MLTGDTEGPAKLISQEIGMTEYFSSLKPHEKYEWLIGKQVSLLCVIYILVGGVIDGIDIKFLQCIMVA